MTVTVCSLVECMTIVTVVPGGALPWITGCGFVTVSFDVRESMETEDDVASLLPLAAREGVSVGMRAGG